MPPELRCVLMSIVGISAARPPIACFERVVDAERRVEDVAVLRDARVLQVVVADARLVQQPRAEGVRVRHAAEPGRRLAERRRRRRVGPAERLLDVLHRARQRDARLVRVAGAVLHRRERRRSPASSVGITCCCRYSRPKVPLPLSSGWSPVGDGIRRRPSRFVLRMFSATGWMSAGVSSRNVSARRVGEELRDEPGLLVGRERPQRVHEVLRRSAGCPAAPVRSHSLATPAIVSAVRTSVSPVGRPVAAVALVA